MKTIRLTEKQGLYALWVIEKNDIKDAVCYLMSDRRKHYGLRLETEQAREELRECLSDDIYYDESCGTTTVGAALMRRLEQRI